MNSITRFLFSSFLFLGTLVGVTILFLFLFFGTDLPDTQQLKNYRPPVVSRFYANDGQAFAEYASEKRLFIPIESTPPLVKNAFLAAEDKNFYSHFGIDILGNIRAVFLNFSRIAQGRRPMGASTITQQVARNFLLPDTKTKVSIDRKIKEAILTLRMENTYSKDYILELYLNEIFLGNRSYGIASAALNYFNKALDELSPGEAALLAALPKAPSRYSPYRNPERARERRNWVLERMAEEGMISWETAREEQAAPIQLERPKIRQVRAGYFAEEVRRQLVKEMGEKGLYEEGLVVRTTMDPKLQQIAHKSLREGLITYDKRHGWRGAYAHLEVSTEETQGEGWVQRINNVMDPAGAETWKLAVVLKVSDKAAEIGFKDGTKGKIPFKSLIWARKHITIDELGPWPKRCSDVLKIGDVILAEALEGKNGQFQLRQIPEVSGGLIAMNPHTGAIVAMSGGFSFEISQFNRATQALRQPGSAIKPILYLGGLEAGLTPVSKLLDAPLAIYLGPNQGYYRPNNISKLFYGPTTLRVALEKSRNIPTVRLVHEVTGLEKISEITQRLGIYEDMQPYLSMALGAGESTLLKMVSAYATFVNGGRQVVPSFFDRIQDRYGKTLQQGNIMSCEACSGIQEWIHQPAPTLLDERPYVIDPAHAYQITSILEGAVKHGSGVRARIPGHSIAGKTGSSNDFHDAWFIGYDPDLIVGIYIGFDVGKNLGENEQSSRVASPVFKMFMERALKGKPSIPFRVPPGIVHVHVNRITGKRAKPGEKGTILEAFKAGTESVLFGETPSQNEEDEETSEEKAPSKSINNIGGVY